MKNFVIHLSNNRKIGPLSGEDLIAYLEDGRISPKDVCEYLITGEKRSVAEFIELKKIVNPSDVKDKTNIFDVLNEPPEDGDSDFVEYRPRTEGKRKEEKKFTELELEIEEREQRSEADEEEKRREKTGPIEAPEKEVIEEQEERIDIDENKTTLFNPESLINGKEIEEGELLANEGERKDRGEIDPPKKKIKRKLPVSRGKKKKMSKIVAFSFFIVLLLLFFDDDDKSVEINLMQPNISYPTRMEYIDEEKSLSFYKEGVTLSKMYSYQKKLDAVRSFLKAYEYNPNNEILAKLVHVYAELLPHYSNSAVSTLTVEKKETSKAKLKGLNTIYEILSTLEKISLNNFDVTIAKVLFLKSLKNYKAAIVTLLKYQVAGGKIEAIYYYELLDLLRLERRYDLADKIYNILRKLKISGVAATKILVQYLVERSKIDEAKKTLDKTIQLYSDAVPLWLEYANILLFQGNMEKLRTVLSILKELALDQSPLYYSQYLKYMGMYFAYKGDNSKAVELFKQSLNFKESSLLRSKLSGLANASGESKTSGRINDLINQSRVLDFIQKSREAKEVGEYEKATLYGIEAVDLETDSIEAKLNLAEIQADKGFYAEALEVLTELNKSNPGQQVIIFALIKLYIDSYKFADANRIMESNSRLEKEQNPDYLFLKAYLYFKSNDPYRAHLHLKKVVKLDPFNDEVHYYFALNYMKFGQYKNALKYINKAIDIDPENVSYRLLYAEIMYFIKGVDFAIGYLNGILRDVSYFDQDSLDKTNADEKKNSGIKVQDIMREILKIRNEEASTILAQVAIYYYKSGQIDLFEKYKKILEDQFNGTKVFYEFLIKQSKIDDRPKEVFEYTKKLLSIEPGNLNVRMEFAEFLMAENKLDEALTELFAIKERLDSYPRVLFLISRIYFIKGELEKSLEYAKIEIKKNNNREYGFILMGDIYLKQNEIGKARESYKDAQKRNPRSSDALVGLGEISLQENQLDRGLDLLIRASKEAPNNPKVWKKLGDTYKQLGQRNLAISAYESYLSLSPDAEDKKEIESAIQYLKQF